jgi:putative Ig domain-containing protein
VKVKLASRLVGVHIGLLFALSVLGLSQTVAGSRPVGGQDQRPAASAPEGGALVIDTTSIPSGYTRGTYTFTFRAHGGIPPLHWKVEKGELSPGLRLEDGGTLHGAPEKPGQYRFTVSVTDNGKPPQTVEREFVLNVLRALVLQWKIPPHVAGSRIEGSVQVSNETPDDFDFTFYVLAVAENGRATAIGYQRFPLKQGTTDFEIPFGENLPHGAYVVHADAVGEVAEKGHIYRDRLQTPGPLQVVAGP